MALISYFSISCIILNYLTFYVKIIQAGQPPVTESQLERVIEELELRCWERIQTIVKNEEGLGIEYDENVICDVCRSVSDLFIFLYKY